VRPAFTCARLGRWMLSWVLSSIFASADNGRHARLPRRVTFQFRNGSVVTLSPVEGRNLREAAWSGHRPNAVTIIEGPSPIDLVTVPLATGQELRAAAGEVESTEAIVRLRRELEIEYSL